MAEEEESPKMFGKLTRVWKGGLTGIPTLAEGEDTAAAGPIIDLSDSSQNSFTLHELYDIEAHPAGSGGYGVVFPAKHRASGTSCTVKAIKKKAADEDYRAQAVDNGMYAFALRVSKEQPHPNVVRYLDFFEDRGCYYVVMDNIAGPELLDQVRAVSSFSESYAQRIIQQVLAALKHLHESIGVFHRDIKLENFRFRASSLDSELVLLDFGFARMIGAPWDRTICGTLMYMAPEVIAVAADPEKAGQDGGYSPAVDMWAVGVMLYGLLTGSTPFSDAEIWTMGRNPTKAVDLVARRMQAAELRRASCEAVDLLRQLLTLDPAARINTSQACAHEWLAMSVEQLQRNPVESTLFQQVSVSSQQSPKSHRPGALATSLASFSSSGSFNIPDYGD